MFAAYLDPISYKYLSIDDESSVEKELLKMYPLNQNSILTRSRSQQENISKELDGDISSIDNFAKDLGWST